MLHKLHRETASNEKDSPQSMCSDVKRIATRNALQFCATGSVLLLSADQGIRISGLSFCELDVTMQIHSRTICIKVTYKSDQRKRATLAKKRSQKLGQRPGNFVQMKGFSRRISYAQPSAICRFLLHRLLLSRYV